MTTLREALDRKKVRTEHYDIVIGDTEAIEQALAQARADQRLAQMRDDTPALEAARQLVTEHEAALAAQTHRITFQAMPPVAFDELLDKHAPTDAQRKKGQTYAPAFEPQLIASCAVDSELTAADWTAEFGSKRWSAADRDGLFQAAWDANVIPRSVSVPKG